MTFPFDFSILNPPSPPRLAQHRPSAIRCFSRHSPDNLDVVDDTRGWACRVATPMLPGAGLHTPAGSLAKHRMVVEHIFPDRHCLHPAKQYPPPLHILRLPTQSHDLPPL